MYSDFVFLDRFLFLVIVQKKNTHTERERDSNKYPIVAFSKNATRYKTNLNIYTIDWENNRPK